MVENRNLQMGDIKIGQKRRLPSELMHRFHSKDDFISYFGSQLQLFVPPKAMINKGKSPISCHNPLQIFCDRS